MSEQIGVTINGLKFARMHTLQSKNDTLYVVKWVNEYELLSKERHWITPLIINSIEGNAIAAWKVKRMHTEKVN